MLDQLDACRSHGQLQVPVMSNQTPFSLVAIHRFTTPNLIGIVWNPIDTCNVCKYVGNG